MSVEPGDRTTPRHVAYHRAGVQEETVEAGYLAKRQLQGGTAGWVLLAGLGVSAVISGDYAGWNFGLAEGGFGGLLIAVVLMAIMYTAMVFGLAELGSALPTAGGGYTFARRALGPWGGYATGIAVLIEYAIALPRSPTSLAPTSNRSACSASPTAGGCTSPSMGCSSVST